MIILSLLMNTIVATTHASELKECVVKAVIKVESSGIPTKINNICYGLMQLQLATARDMGFTGKLEELLIGSINKKYGTAYIKWLLKRYNNQLFTALDAYNRGILNVEKKPYVGKWEEHPYVGLILKNMEPNCI